MNTHSRYVLISVLTILIMFSSVIAKESDRENDRKGDSKAVTIPKAESKPVTAPVATTKPAEVTITASPTPTLPTPTAPEAGEQINWWVISGGGSSGASTNYQLSGTVGQTATGFGNSTNFQLNAGYWQLFATGPGGCCVGRVGDANYSGEDEPTIGDVSTMIDAKFITGSCDGIITCMTEADINQSGGANPTCDDITIGDISTLIDYLFITGQSLGLPECL